MADRGASAAFLTELAQSTNSPVYMVEMYFDDVTVRLTDAWRDISWAGNTFTANGDFLKFEGLTETSDLQIPNVTFTASGINQTWVAIALTKQFTDRRMVIYKALLDYTQSVITSPVAIFDGRMDAVTISDTPGDTCTVAISATSQWSDFERTPGRHTNTAEQQVFFPGDLFFQYCDQLNRTIKWGAV